MAPGAGIVQSVKDTVVGIYGSCMRTAKKAICGTFLLASTQRAGVANKKRKPQRRAARHLRISADGKMQKHSAWGYVTYRLCPNTVGKENLPAVQMLNAASAQSGRRLAAESNTITFTLSIASGQL